MNSILSKLEQDDKLLAELDNKEARLRSAGTGGRSILLEERDNSRKSDDLFGGDKSYTPTSSLHNSYTPLLRSDYGKANHKESSSYERSRLSDRCECKKLFVN